MDSAICGVFMFACSLSIMRPAITQLVSQSARPTAQWHVTVDAVHRRHTESALFTVVDLSRITAAVKYRDKRGRMGRVGWGTGGWEGKFT